MDYYEGAYTGEEIDTAVGFALANKSYPFKINLEINRTGGYTYEQTFVINVLFEDNAELSLVAVQQGKVTNCSVNANLLTHNETTDGKTQIKLNFIVGFVPSESETTAQVTLSCVLSQVADVKNVVIPAEEV